MCYLSSAEVERTRNFAMSAPLTLAAGGERRQLGCSALKARATFALLAQFTAGAGHG